MQVTNNKDWPKRSLFYLCRLYTNLVTGQDYRDIIPAIHIGILNFTLFPESPEFYTRNYMMNQKTQQIFSSDFALNVLDLKSIHLATKEDKACKLDYWARLFAAKTWEEIKMLGQNNENIHEAVVTMCELSADDKIRLQCEARERYEFDRLAGLRVGAKLEIISLTRKKHAKCIPAKECAKMLETNANLIEEIYCKIDEHPTFTDEEIYACLR